MTTLDPENERRPAQVQLSRLIDLCKSVEEANKFELRNIASAAKDVMQSAALAKVGDERTNQNLFEDAKQLHEMADATYKAMSARAKELGERMLGTTAAIRRYLVSLAPEQVQEKFQTQIENPDKEPQANDGHKHTEDEPDSARSTY